MGQVEVHPQGVEFCPHQNSDVPPVVHTCSRPVDHGFKHQCSCGHKWRNSESTWPIKEKEEEL